jgi:hypothetical protein
MKVSVKKLKPAIKQALRALGFTKREVSVDISETYTVSYPGDDGYRGVFQLVGKENTPVRFGAFGGGSCGVSQSAVDTDMTDRPLPLETVCLKGQQGQHTYIYITARTLADVSA